MVKNKSSKKNTDVLLRVKNVSGKKESDKGKNEDDVSIKSYKSNNLDKEKKKINEKKKQYLEDTKIRILNNVNFTKNSFTKFKKLTLKKKLEFLKPNKYQLILILILLFAFFARTYQITEPFIGHQDFCNAQYANYGQNYLRYGLQTNLIPIENIVPTTPENFQYYPNHLIFTGIFTAISFLIFEVQEWSVRLVSVFFSLISIIVIYYLTKELWNKKTALLASFFLAFMPMTIYFGRITVSDTVVATFTVLCYYFYVLWLKYDKNHYFAGLLLSFVIGSLTDWHIYFIVPLIGLHYLFRSLKRTDLYLKKQNNQNILTAFQSYLSKRNNIMMLSFLIITVLVPIAFFANIYLTIGESGLNSMFGSLTHRTGVSVADSRTEDEFTVTSFFQKEIIRSHNLFTPLVCILFFFWSSNIFYSLIFKKKYSKNNDIIILMFISSLINICLFKQMVWTHEFILLPFAFPFAIASAVCFKQITDSISFLCSKMKMHLFSLKKNTLLVNYILLFLISFCFISYAIPETKQLYSQGDMFYYQTGIILNNISSSNESILATYGHPTTRYYAQRDVMMNIRTINNLKGLLNDKIQNYAYFVMFNDERCAELNNYLFANYKLLEFKGTVVFDLREKPDKNAFNTTYIPQYPTKINFNNQIEFLGYDLDFMEENKLFIQKYLSGSGTRAFRITYYWKSLKPMNETHKVFVHFLNEREGIVFQQDHMPFYGLYNTSQWKAGEIIKETYNVDVWNNVKLGKYYIKVGLYNGAGRLPTINENYEFLNQTPTVQNPVNVIYNNTFEFLGYDINKTKIEQEDKFKITYYWKCLNETDEDYTIFVHFLNESGKIRFQNDHKPSVQTSQWKKGQIFKETHTVRIPKTTNLGNYSLSLGFYIKGKWVYPTDNSQIIGKLIVIEPEPVFEIISKTNEEKSKVSLDDQGIVGMIEVG